MDGGYGVTGTLGGCSILRPCYLNRYRYFQYIKCTWGHAMSGQPPVLSDGYFGPISIKYKCEGLEQ